MVQDDAAMLPRQNTNSEGNMGSEVTKSREGTGTPGATNTPDSPGGSTRKPSPDEGIKFSDDNFGPDDGTDHVFQTTERTTIKDFKWEVVGTDIRLKMIELIAVEHPDEPIKDVKFDDSTQVGSDFFLEPGWTSTKLNLTAFLDGGSKLEFDDVYAVKLTYERANSMEEDEAVSDYFTVMEGSDPDTAEELQDKVLEAQAGASGITSPGDQSDPSNPDSEASATGVSDSNNDDDNDDDDDAPSGGGGGALGPGAIAGIVVGSVVFLALIGLLAFFLLRRRRKTKRSAGYADAGHRDASNAYIVDKIDTSAQSPRSPYSDDGQEQHTPLDPQAHHHHHSNFHTPAGEGSNGSEYAGLYQANQHQHQQETRALGSDDGVQSPPRMQSRSNTGNYSHLVEEGMTADDIRRLEEEERQLDDEIERSGRR